jgi:dissimilatory sulfite reductase (desulfoviridin) alpha/beta subunit
VIGISQLNPKRVNKMNLDLSPNEFWSRLGFTIVRDGKYHRTILNANGVIVCKNAGYDTELAIGRWIYGGAIHNVKS